MDLSSLSKHGTLSEKVHITNSTRQGYPLSPLLFILSLEPFIKTINEQFAQYGYVSNLKINDTKSEAMNVTLPEHILKSTMENSPFKWDPKTLKYLGIRLTPQISSNYEQNFPPLLKTIKRDLEKWHAGTFSWFGPFFLPIS